MVNVLDENGVRQLAQGIKDNCKEWVKDTRRRKQIIIGRAIRPVSCFCSREENWYAFMGNPCIGGISREKQKLEWHIFIKHIDEKEYKEIKNIHKVEDNRIFLFLGGYALLDDNTLLRDDLFMYKVDKYRNWTTKQVLYISYKFAPTTLKGTSLTQEWQGGKHVNNRKISLKILRDDLKYYSENCRHLHKKLEYRRVVKMRRSKFVREREDITSGTVLKHKKETSWLNEKSSHKSILKTGVYKVRDKQAKTSWQTIYVKMKNNGFVSVVFK